MMTEGKAADGFLSSSAGAEEKKNDSASNSAARDSRSGNLLCSLQTCRSDIEGFRGTSLLSAFQKEYSSSTALPNISKGNHDSFNGPANLVSLHAASALCNLVILTHSDCTTRFLYSLNPQFIKMPKAAGKLPLPSFELTVLKGSVKAHAWSMAARFDDDYLLEVLNLPRSYLPSYAPESPSENVDILWNMNGYDFLSGKIGMGIVSWNNMKALRGFICNECVPHVAACIRSIGVLKFAQIFSKVLMCLPIREHFGKHYEPMPASSM